MCRASESVSDVVADNKPKTIQCINIAVISDNGILGAPNKKKNCKIKLICSLKEFDTG